MNNAIGLLIPKSVMYPSMNFDMMAGLKNGLASAGVSDHVIKVESIGVGADNKQIYAACEKLLFDGCKVIIGYLNPASVDMVETLFANADAILLVIDSGYHYPDNLNKKSNVFHISLQGTLCSRVVAKTAINDGNRFFAFTGSFLDAGYRTLHAFSCAVEDDNCGFTFNHITKLKREEFTIAPLNEHLQTADVHAVFTSFSGDMMQDLFANAASQNIFEHHAVYGSMFMGDEQWLAQCSYPGVTIKLCTTWATSLDNSENKKFIDTLSGLKQKTNLFSMICWEVALLLPTIFASDSTSSAIRSLEGMKYSGPRGEVIIDEASHYAFAPVYNALIMKNEHDGKCILEITGASTFTEEQRAKHKNDILNFSGHASSWHNAYACLES